MIHLDHVTKVFGTKTAVDDLCLHVKPGEVFAFLGPNGAGKTTTIKLMCGLLFPTAGTVRVAEFDLQTQGDQARQLISYVPDQPFLYEKLTGRELLGFIADMYGMTEQNKKTRIQMMIELFELDSFADELTERYSHGMRQRTVFASALLHEPRLLVVDEPTVGLDPRSIRHAQGHLAAGGETGHDGVSLDAFARHRPGTGRPHRRRRPGQPHQLRNPEGFADAGLARRIA